MPIIVIIFLKHGCNSQHRYGSINMRKLFKREMYAGTDSAKQKNIFVSDYMLFKIRVGRLDYYFIFCNNFVCLKYFL